MSRPRLVSAEARILHGVGLVHSHRNALARVSSIRHHRIVDGPRDEKYEVISFGSSVPFNEAATHAKSCKHRVDCVSIIVMTCTDTKDIAIRS